MNEKGKNILPMIGFIILVVLLLGGFSVAMALRGDSNGDTKPVKSNLNQKKSGFTIDETYEIATSDIQKIKVSTLSSQVNIITHDDNGVKAHFSGHVIAINNNTLPYLEVKKEGDTAHVQIHYPNNPISSITGQTTLDVWIPENWSKELQVSSSSGKIEAVGLTGDNISIETLSGEIAGNSLDGDTIRMGTASGSIHAEGVDAKDKFYATTLSGSIEIETLVCDEAKVDSASGSIQLRNVKSAQKIEADNLSGRIEIEADKGSVKAETSSGSIQVRLKESLDSIQANSISGAIKLQIPGDSQFKIDVETISGSIHCNDFDIKLTTSKKNKLKGTVGNGKGDIDAETTSGSVTISKN